MKRPTLTQGLADLFTSRPDCWINARDLAAVGGFAAWRTRVSDLRRRGMRIVNRQRRLTRPDGTSYVQTEYRYSPLTTIETSPGWTLQP